ncbi:MAG: hypothetical protein WBF90_17545 [Rivularia sp. (in: cyanobacteria)]
MIKLRFRCCSFSRFSVPFEIPERLLAHQSHGMIWTHPGNQQVGVMRLEAVMKCQLPALNHKSATRYGKDTLPGTRR